MVEKALNWMVIITINPFIMEKWMIVHPGYSHKMTERVDMI